MLLDGDLRNAGKVVIPSDIGNTTRHGQGFGCANVRLHDTGITDMPQV
jgi:hypothetical protein